MKRCLVASVVLLLGFSSPSFVRAGDVTIDFDSLPAAGLSGGLTGTAITNYFASYGITLSGVTPGTAVTVYDTRAIFAGQVVVPTSPFNVIAQSGSPDPVSYTLNFALPQDQFSMSRTAVHPGSTGDALPEWHAFAYDASGKLLSSVGENAFSVFTDLPAKTFHS